MDAKTFVSFLRLVVDELNAIGYWLKIPGREIQRLMAQHFGEGI